MKHKKQALAKSLLALLLCVAMLVSTTFAWFTDVVVSGINTIAAGNLDVELYHSNAAVSDEKVDANTTLFLDLQGNPILWEPGVVSYENLRVTNEGDLALIYQLALNTANENYILDTGARLSQVLKVGVVEGGITATDRAAVVASVDAADWTTLSAFLEEGDLLADGEETWGIVIYWQPGDNDNNWNANNGKQLSSGDALTIDLGVKLTATQMVYENDSFGDDYDANAKDDVFPVFGGGTASAPVEVVDGVTASAVTITVGDITATIPAGVKVAEGTTALTLTVKTLTSSAANIVLGEDEAIRSLDVHVEGVAADNTTPITITLPEVAPTGLNLGNYKVYHVEDATNEMTLVANDADFSAHNQYKYDPATGDVVLYMATFSEVAVIAEEAKWEGGVDHSWYVEKASPYTVANADQLWSFSQIVGGMAEGIGRDSFEGKTVTLISDINLGDEESENNPDLIFYPIGYNSDDGSYEKTGVAVSTGFYNFCGTFDGNGHSISNFYQNTWEMKGDHNWYDATLQYYRDGMGLFGKVYGGTVKNLTVKNFSSDGEIATTGVIAAYADGATFENIAIFNCNPRVYNIGNGGIVGCVGWYAKDADLKTTFTNITVDNSNKISALWGSWDVACGGIVGQYYPTSGQTSANSPANAGIEFTNCHVSAVMDVYNDVCANYQYYAYRYTGMLIGSVRENETIDGHSYPKMDDITASGCTVNFGSWNNYYYCELVANSLASYTHDHQFSRLEQVQSVDTTKMEIIKMDGTTASIPSSGRVNYVVVTGEHATENADCFHFVDGKVHNHKDYNGDGIEDKETVNGESVYVENNYHIYLPFGSLFTGYGWGVTSLGLDNYEGVTTDVKIAEGDYENSDVKFNSTSKNEFSETQSVSIGSIFSASGKGAAIKDSQVQVFVSPADDKSTVTAIYTPNTSDWTAGILTFNGTGKAIVTITDYYFCTPTTITVTVSERQVVEKFEVVMNNGDFLHRVGNSGTVALDKLFKAKDGVNIGTVSVTVEAVNGTAASGTFTANTSDWTQGTIQFSGTGVVKVTITDNDYCTPTELCLEVVDATNITSAIAGTGKDFVLLKNVDYSGTYLYYKNSTLYGNGFTIDITGADHSDLKDSSNTDSNKSAYCNIWMVDSRFDNVQIKGSVYPKVGMTADADYGNAAVRTEGDCYITNSYISNCRVPLRVQGNTTLISTVVDGGRYANIELRSGKLTLDGVTTINTARKGSDGTTDVIGFGIVIHDEAANASISVIGDDGLKQYNWVGETEHNSILSGDAYLSNAYKLIFNENNNDTIYFDYNNDRFVNTGILCLCADINKDVVTGLDDRYFQEVSGYEAWVLTYDNSKHTDWFDNSVSIDSVAFTPKQYPVIPKYSGTEAQTVEFTKGETYYFDTSVLTAEKFGQKLGISSVVLNGDTYNYGDKISITEGGVYEIVYTVVDPYNYNADATNTTTVNHTVSITVTAIAKDAEILAPKFTFIDQNGNKYEATTVKAGDKTYVMPNVTAADSTTNAMSSINIGSASISNTTVYFPVATGYTVRSGSNFNRYYPLFNGINITDYTIAGDTTGTTYTTSSDYTSLVGSSDEKFIIPANGGQTNCGDYVKKDGQAGNAAGNSDSGWQGAGYSTSYGGTYLKSGNTSASSGADSNGYERIVWVEYCFNAGNGDVYYYRIGYHCNEVSAQSCFTPDTLITLADGTQKRVDELQGTDKILAWDFFTGSYVEKNISLLVNHGASLNDVIYTSYSDGTLLKLVGEHGVFDYDLNKFVYITANNVTDFIGHRFVKQNLNDGYDIVTMTDGYVKCEYVEAWSVSSAVTSNAFASGLLTVAPPEDFYNWIEMDSKLHYDVEQFMNDVETYGLYTYDDFADYVTYEQFIDWNGAYLKVAVEKGYFTFDYILELIELYKGWMPN